MDWRTDKNPDPKQPHSPGHVDEVKELDDEDLDDEDLEDGEGEDEDLDAPRR